LIGILAPQILNKTTSEDEEEDSDHSMGNGKHLNYNLEEREVHSQGNYKDALSFADLENQSLVELIELD